MKINAFAKINLFLEVGSVRDDGYHNIYSVMQSVSLSDTVEIIPNKSGNITLECAGLDCDRIGADSDNLVVRAAMLFREYSGIADGFDIKLFKSIPIGAGLGGGSADAAATLRLLCQMYSCDIDGLILKSSKLGADVPFCAVGGAMRAEGIGEELTPVRVRDIDCVIAIGEHRVSTREAFSKLDSLRGSDSIKMPDGFIKTLEDGTLADIGQGLYNAFEICGCDCKVKEIMRRHGSLGECLSGSGPSVFGIFSDSASAENAARALTREKYRAFVCRFIESPYR